MEQLAQWVSISSDGATGAVRSLHENDLLANSSFHLRLPGFRWWVCSPSGVVAPSPTSEGREGDLTLDGEVTTWLLGTDWSWGQQPDSGDARRSTAGLMVSRSSSDGATTAQTPVAAPGTWPPHSRECSPGVVTASPNGWREGLGGSRLRSRGVESDLQAAHGPGRRHAHHRPESVAGGSRPAGYVAGRW